MRGMAKVLAGLLWLVLIPTAVFAQASIAGVVQDTSGAVVPGVTVEAASPALIEKVRAVVTDGTGRYRIVDLRPADQRLMVDGLPVGRVDMPELGAYTPDMSATQEISVETGGFSAESALGGIRLNIIPREGGNTYSGTVFGSYASEQLASSNLT